MWYAIISQDADDSLANRLSTCEAHLSRFKELVSVGLMKTRISKPVYTKK